MLLCNMQEEGQQGVDQPLISMSFWIERLKQNNSNELPCVIIILGAKTKLLELGTLSRIIK